MKHHSRGWLFFLLISTTLLLASCGDSGNPEVTTSSPGSSPAGPITSTPLLKTRIAALAWTRTSEAGVQETNLARTPSATPLPSQTPTFTLTPSLTSTPRPTAELAADGPWLVYYNNRHQSYMLANPDGSGKSVLPFDADKVISMASSSRGQIAMVAEWPELEQEEPRNIALVILDLPGGGVRDVLPLLSYEKIPQEYLPYISSGGMAWSPDGRYLAFVGALDGPTADLYVYESLTGEYFRLTTGLNRAYQPEWSPDGKWIVHQETDNIGGMCDLIAVWAAAVNLSEVRLLFQEDCSFHILDWFGPESFVSISIPNGPRRGLKTVSLADDTVLDLYPQNAFYDFGDTAWAVDPDKRVFAYSMMRNPQETGGDADGLYTTSFLNPIPKMISDDLFWTLTWFPGGEVFAAAPDEECGTVVFSSEGDFSCLESGGRKRTPHAFSVSPDGNWLVVPAGEGLFLYNQQLQSTEITTSGGKSFTRLRENIFWQPNSRAFLFRNAKTLYYLSLPNLEPVEISSLMDDYTRQVFWNNNLSGFFFLDKDHLKYYDINQGSAVHIDSQVSPYTITWAGMPPHPGDDHE